MFEVSQHGRLAPPTELDRQQVGDVTLWPLVPAAPPPPPPIPLPGLPFLGPLEAEQLVDVRSPLSSMGDE